MYPIRKVLILITNVFLLGAFPVFGNTILKAYEEANRFSIAEINFLKEGVEKEYQSDQNLENAVKLMLVKHNYALAKKSEIAIDEGMKTIRILYKKFKNPLFLAYLGSVETMKGDISPDSNLKTVWVKRGIKKMDQAVASVEKGDDIMVFVRMLRGNNYLNLPKMMKKIKTAQEDFKWIYENVYKSNPDSFKGENGASLLYSYGKVCEREGDLLKAAQLYDECIKKYEDTEHCRKAKTDIKNIN